MDSLTAVAVRPFTPDDIPAAHTLTSSFGWPHRLEDWEAMARLGLGVVAEHAGALAGTALAWLFGRDHASIGLVGVSPALQGHGLGRRMMTALLARLEGRSVVLHATEAARQLYASLGFQAEGVIRQYQGAPFGAGLVPLPGGQRLRPLGRSDPGQLAALDRAATGLERGALLRALLQTATGIVLDRGGAPAGFALLRRFGRGQVIGPVVAPDAHAAQALISHFLGQRAGQFIRVDVPDAAELGPWLTGLGLPDAGPGIRMVRGPRPQPDGCHASTFALASQAFG